MATVVKKEFPNEVLLPFGFGLAAPAFTVVAGGEYADEGEPDVVVGVFAAYDRDGADKQEDLAKRIASVVTQWVEENE